MISPAQLEVATLQALTSFPFLIGETGIEEADFGADHRRAYLAALRETRFFLPGGAASALDVATRAGLERSWVAAELAVSYTVVEQAREVVRKLRGRGVGERFTGALREAMLNARGEEILQSVAELTKRYASQLGTAATVTDMETATLGYLEGERRRLTGGERRAQSTGLYALNRAIVGWRPGELTTLVAAGGAGKSTLGSWFRRYLATQRISTLKFSGEMTEEQEGERLAHAECRRPMYEALDNTTMISEAEDRIRQGGLLRYMRLCVRSRFEPNWTRAVIEGEKVAQGGVGLVELDHLRHLTLGTPTRNQTDYEIVSAAAAEAKAIAKDTQTAVLLVTHLNNKAFEEVRKKDGGEPDPGMIRGSGRIFEESDNVLCLWRPQQVSTLYVWKARQTGAKTKIPLNYDVLTQSFAEI